MRSAIVVIILFGLLSCSSSGEMDTRGIKVGDIAPNILSTDINGQEFNLEELRGSIVLIDFWGSWCGPCIKEAPEIVSIHEEFSPLGLQVVSVAVEKNDKNWKKAAEKLGYRWEHQLVEISQYVRFNKIASDYKVTDIPSVFLLDKQGQVLVSGGSAAEIEAKLKTLL
jgi:thiol-disulfide isomerase/thioredoxin